MERQDIEQAIADLRSRVDRLEQRLGDSHQPGCPTSSSAVEESERRRRAIPKEHLSWTRWWRTPATFEAMQSLTWHNLANYNQIFDAAMSLLFYDPHGNPGLLYRGELYAHSQAVVDWNGGRRLFTPFEQEAYLRDGRFFYNAHDQKWIYPPEPQDLGIFGRAVVPGNWIIFNPARHLSHATQIGIPANAQGVDMLAWITAATMLHEIMHNNGARHGSGFADARPGSDYASSLPFVAEQSVLRASPYWSTFEQWYTRRLWLTDGAGRTCGTE
ncbi:MAG: hypothetical protein U0744_22095 [Gemmataceae bacterium]